MADLGLTGRGRRGHLLRLLVLLLTLFAAFTAASLLSGAASSAGPGDKVEQALEANIGTVPGAKVDREAKRATGKIAVQPRRHDAREVEIARQHCPRRFKIFGERSLAHLVTILNEGRPAPAGIILRLERHLHNREPVLPCRAMRRKDLPDGCRQAPREESRNIEVAQSVHRVPVPATDWLVLSEIVDR